MMDLVDIQQLDISGVSVEVATMTTDDNTKWEHVDAE